MVGQRPLEPLIGVRIPVSQPIRTKRVSRLARGFAPRFGGRIFKQFPNEPILFRPKGESKAAIFCPKAITN